MGAKSAIESASLNNDNTAMILHRLFIAPSVSQDGVGQIINPQPARAAPAAYRYTAQTARLFRHEVSRRVRTPLERSCSCVCKSRYIFLRLQSSRHRRRTHARRRQSQSTRYPTHEHTFEHCLWTAISAAKLCLKTLVSTWHGVRTTTPDR